MWRHVLPNVSASLIVVATFGVAGAILTEAGLSFLGLGVPLAIPSWGGMLAEGRQFVDTRYWLALFPGAALFVTVMGINLLGRCASRRPRSVPPDPSHPDLHGPPVERSSLMTRPEPLGGNPSAPAIGWILTVLAVLAWPGSEAPAQQRPVVVVQSGEAATLDWHMHCDKNAHEPDRQIFDTLLRRNLKTLQLEGNLAESWRLLNDTTWQFKLRRDVKFHNGEPFDATAVKFSIDRMLDPKQAAPGRTSIATIDRVEIVDPLTVNVITKTPFPLLPVRMSPGHCGTVGIVPPKYVAQVGDAGFAVKPVGTGPYKFVEWVKDERLVLDANKDYHRGAPAIDRLVFRPIPELTTRVAALLSGQADLVSDVPPDQVAKVKASGVARTEVSTLGGFVIMMKITNYLMPGPWQDVRVRKAMNHAIDMPTIIKTVLEGYGDILGRPAGEGSLRVQPQRQVVRRTIPSAPRRSSARRATRTASS